MSKTIAAIATGNSVSGIGVIRISGDSAIEIAQKVFKSADNTPLSSLKGYTAKFGNVYSKGEKYDNAIALVFRAPKSIFKRKNGPYASRGCCHIDIGKRSGGG